MSTASDLRRWRAAQDPQNAEAEELSLEDRVDEIERKLAELSRQVRDELRARGSCDE